ncbi:hypothetical protein ABZ725_14170 [Streptomyces sp. NPDC006872]|uniref:hypothetical protein n=1 Tax=Streptomyces sp. NPDC006872 TaxID=3155720 RepID=UPI0033F9DBFA
MPAAHASRADIVQLLREGLGNVRIADTLGVRRDRVARIRAEEDISPCERTWPTQGVTLEQKWTAHTQPVTGGHMRWTGPMRGTTPNFCHGGNQSARRVAFRLGHGRDPVGPVLPGCGHDWCIAPDHTTDTPMRNASQKSYGRAA